MHSFSPYKRGIGPDIFWSGYSVRKKKENFKKKEKIELIFYRFEKRALLPWPPS